MKLDPDWKILSDGFLMNGTKGIKLVKITNYADGTNGYSEMIATSIIEQNGIYEDKSLAECVLPNTEILANLAGSSKLASDMKQGDSIVYYNFETGKNEEGTVYETFKEKHTANFVRYEFEDETILEVTEYHPIYTAEGWKAFVENGKYDEPQVGDLVKTVTGWRTIKKIEKCTGTEEYYNFIVMNKQGEKIYNYYGNGILVEGPTHIK